MSSEWPGVGDRLDLEPVDLEATVDDRQPELRPRAATWSVCECVRSTAAGVSPCCADDLQQRLERRARVDEDGGAAALSATR